MSITDKEKSYISKIFNHGVSHLIDDFVPNRLICVHNMHWCLENVLRKATRDWTNIDYQAGFEEILNKFNNRINIPRALKNALINVNAIRNDMEHRSLYHDLRDISNLIPQVEKFITWIMKTKFNTSIDLYAISSADEINILSDFDDWKIAKIENFGITDAENMIFILIIPSTYSPNLIDMHLDGLNEMVSSRLDSGIMIAGRNPEHESNIEKYFRSFRFLLSNPAQVFSVPTHMQYYNENSGEELRIFPDGRVYICLKYGVSTQNALDFNLENLFSGRSRYTINNEIIDEYNLPFSEYSPNQLEYILKVVLFSFHSDCIQSGVKIPAKYHRLFITLPNMRINGEPRKLERHLDENHWFESERVYCGDEDDLVFIKTINYDMILEMLSEFKNWTYSFFRNPSDTSFM